MSLFQGLHLYEIVLMVMGATVFVCAIPRMRKGKKDAVAYILAAAVLVGWPSVKSIDFGKITVELNNQTDELLKNPTDAAARRAVAENLSKIEGRSASDPRTATTIARAQFAIGNEKAAEASLNQALKADPTLPEAKALQRKIASVQKLDQLTQQVTSNPRNEAARQELTQHVAQVAKEPIANPDALAKVAEAQAVVGNQQAAAGTAETVFKINPNSAAAMQLRKTLATVPH